MDLTTLKCSGGTPAVTLCRIQTRLIIAQVRFAKAIRAPVALSAIFFILQGALAVHSLGVMAGKLAAYAWAL